MIPPLSLFHVTKIPTNSDNRICLTLFSILFAFLLNKSEPLINLRKMEGLWINVFDPRSSTSLEFIHLSKKGFRIFGLGPTRDFLEERNRNSESSCKFSHFRAFLGRGKLRQKFREKFRTKIRGRTRVLVFAF